MYESWNLADLCKNVQCKNKEFCIIQSKGVATCAKKAKKHEKEYKSKARNFQPVSYRPNLENLGIRQCKPCPVVKPQFVCGTDNSTYSSICRLNFHNCVHKTDIKVVCQGFCPCSHPSRSGKEDRARQKWDKYLNTNFKHLKKESVSKYKKYNKHKQTPDKLYNSVLPENDNYVSKAKDNVCNSEDLKIMGSRLVDWFSVVLNDQKKKHPEVKKRNFNQKVKLANCPSEAAWMFHHLDTDTDLKLSQKELYYLEHDENEKCLKPYLLGCDEDRDAYLSPYEWCTCFDRESEYFKLISNK